MQIAPRSSECSRKVEDFVPQARTDLEEQRYQLFIIFRNEVHKLIRRNELTHRFE